jgi:hypothetical protein
MNEFNAKKVRVDIQLHELRNISLSLDWEQFDVNNITDIVVTYYETFLSPLFLKYTYLIKLMETNSKKN